MDTQNKSIMNQAVSHVTKIVSTNSRHQGYRTILYWSYGKRNTCSHQISNFDRSRSKAPRMLRVPITIISNKRGRRKLQNLIWECKSRMKEITLSFQVFVHESNWSILHIFSFSIWTVFLPCHDKQLVRINIPKKEKKLSQIFTITLI